MSQNDGVLKDPYNPEIREAGRYLFFDQRLSHEGNISCAGCHDPALAFTDGYRRSLNAKAEMTQRNSPTLLNLELRKSFNWTQPEVHSIFKQLEGPLYNHTPDEMAYYRDPENILQRFRDDSEYSKIYQKAYHRPVSMLSTKDVRASLEAYIYGLKSRNSSFDRYTAGDTTALTSLETEGYRLFYSKKYSCISCHGGQDLQEAEDSNQLFYLDIDKNITIRIPTLRNVAITSPYYHDGSQTSLARVISQHKSVFHPDNNKNPISDIQPADLKPLLAFLHTLTDTSYLANPYFTSTKKNNILE